MSRSILHLKNVVEDRTIGVIDAKLSRERYSPPKAKRSLPVGHIWMNGRLYVPANDPRAQALFSILQGKGDDHG